MHLRSRRPVATEPSFCRMRDEGAAGAFGPSSLSRSKVAASCFPEAQIYNFVSLREVRRERTKSHRNQSRGFDISFSQTNWQRVSWLRAVCSISTIRMDNIRLDPLFTEILTKFLVDGIFRAISITTIRKFVRCDYGR